MPPGRAGNGQMELLVPAAEGRLPCLDAPPTGAPSTACQPLPPFGTPQPGTEEGPVPEGETAHLCKVPPSLSQCEPQVLQAKQNQLN